MGWDIIAHIRVTDPQQIDLTLRDSVEIENR
jgi:hypothetical protein